jgi:hypothetical protein
MVCGAPAGAARLFDRDAVFDRPMIKYITAVALE